MRTAIFVSYRRSDSLQAAGRLCDNLTEMLPSAAIFRDVQDIDPGARFSEALSNALSLCQVILVLIGRSWIASQDERGARRLDDPKDWVRIEVSTALKRDIRVIPVLLDGAALPAPNELPAELSALVERQVFEIADGRWKTDVQRLSAALQKSYPNLRANLPWDPGERTALPNTPPRTLFGNLSRQALSTVACLPEIWLHPLRGHWHTQRA